jgi:hypothetical protein
MMSNVRFLGIPAVSKETAAPEAGCEAAALVVNDFGKSKDDPPSVSNADFTPGSFTVSQGYYGEYIPTSPAT